MTWFAADRDVVWLDPGDVEGAAARIGLFLFQESGEFS
jgi:hypothetical protein